MVILNTSYENGKARIELNSEELALIALKLKCLSQKRMVNKSKR